MRRDLGELRTGSPKEDILHVSKNKSFGLYASSIYIWKKNRKGESAMRLFLRNDSSFPHDPCPRLDNGVVGLYGADAKEESKVPAEVRHQRLEVVHEHVLANLIRCKKG